MNNVRRKALRTMIDDLDRAYYSLEDIVSKEQEAFDNMPEGLQQSERGETMEEILGVLEDALNSIEDVKGSLEELL